MDDWLINLIGSAAIPLVALAAKYLINTLAKTRTKEIIATSTDGKIDTFVVNSEASLKDIENTVRAAMSFESDIANALKVISANNNKLTAQAAKSVDFIIKSNNKKYAVEVKLNPDRLKRENIERYLSAEDGLNHLLLVSRTKAPDRVRESLKSYLDAGRLSFVTVSQESDTISTLKNAIAHVEGISKA